MLVSYQIRAARGLLHWSARVLAERAGVEFLADDDGLGVRMTAK